MQGGIQRTFPPLTDLSKNNAFLKALIQFSFQQLPIEEERLSGAWKIQLHQMRVVTNDKETGKPTPEGIHRDGVDFVFIYMINCKNITGGGVTVLFMMITVNASILMHLENHWMLSLFGILTCCMKPVLFCQKIHKRKATEIFC